MRVSCYYHGNTLSCFLKMWLLCTSMSSNCTTNRKKKEENLRQNSFSSSPQSLYLSHTNSTGMHSLVVSQRNCPSSQVARPEKQEHRIWKLPFSNTSVYIKGGRNCFKMSCNSWKILMQQGWMNIRQMQSSGRSAVHTVWNGGAHKNMSTPCGLSTLMLQPFQPHTFDMFAKSISIAVPDEEFFVSYSTL